MPTPSRPMPCLLEKTHPPPAPPSDWSTLPSRTLSHPYPLQRGLLSAFTLQHCHGQQLHIQLPSAPAVLRKLLPSLQNPSQNLPLLDPFKPPGLCGPSQTQTTAG